MELDSALAGASVSIPTPTRSAPPSPEEAAEFLEGAGAFVEAVERMLGDGT